MDETKRADLYKQGYRMVGNHSAIKVCTWTKKCLRNEDVCYKKTFYGINTHRCVQMTPALQVCTHRCEWCWRDIAHTDDKWVGPVDSPSEIIDGCISEHIKYLRGFGGNEKVSEEKLKEAYSPKHFAISLSGEPTFYPRLAEFIEELSKRKLTSFLVTNGTNPEMIEKLKSSEPTQLYLTVPAPNKEIYERVCQPLIKDGWDKILKSMESVNSFSRNVFRLTLVKGNNMVNAREYGELIKRFKPRWVEAKAYMWVGYSRERLAIENMPRHEDIKEFAQEISKYSGYPIVDEKPESRVILLGDKGL